MYHELQIACWYEAIRNNHHEAITTLYQLFNLDINDSTSYEEYFATPMLIATETDNEDTIRLIAFLGGQVNKPDYYGITPLYKAVENDTKTSIKVLLELGADLYTDVHGKLSESEYGFTTPLDLMKLYNNGKPYDFVVPYTKEHKRLRKLQVYANVVDKMMKQYRRSVENVWCPGGTGYITAKQEFYQLLNNAVVTPTNLLISSRLYSITAP
jgi:hypothetical protein